MANLAVQTKDRTAHYLLAGMSVAVGLAWNDAVKKSIDYYLPLSKSSVRTYFVYALALTVILVLISFSILQLGVKPTPPEAAIKEMITS